jgi:hypothetical protein
MKDYNRDYFKLSFDKEDTCFYVNTKKRTVTCKVACRLEVPFSWESPVEIGGRYMNIVATAKCCKGDEFDVERGKRIALAKAENKAYRQAASYLFDQLKHLLFFQNGIRVFLEKADKQCEHNDNYIDMISNTQNPNYKESVSDVKNGDTIYM